MGPPPVFFGWALCSSPEAGLVLSSAHWGVLTSRCLTDAANLPTSFFYAGALLSASLVSGLAAHSNSLGNVKTLPQGPHLRPVKSEAPGAGLKQQEFLKPSRRFQCVAKTGSPCWGFILLTNPRSPPSSWSWLHLVASALPKKSHLSPGPRAFHRGPSSGWRLPASI